MSIALDSAARLAFCSLLVALVSAAGAAQLPELPPHPRLLLDSQGISRLKERVARHDWAAARWNAVKAEADKLLGKPVELPPRGGNWSHWYACPEHGAVLKRGKQTGPWQWEHTCPIGGELLRSDPANASTDYDGCVIASIHGDLATHVRTLGLVYQVTGDARYAARAREILLAYANKYADYPLHNTKGEPKVGGGRIGAQSLDESVRLIPICQGADFIWDTLSEDDRSTIANKLLLPAVKEVIIPHKLGIHNIQCWKNSAVGLVGLLLGDQELIQEAIYNADSGYGTQLKKGVMPDGGWWEGAWGYHFYTVSALWPLTEAARNCGIQLYGDKLKSMFDAPLKFAAPDLTLPAFNDSGPVNLKASAAIYELAYSRFGNPAYLQLISPGQRKSDYALWFGRDDLPEPPVRTWTGQDYPQAGYAVLARGKGEKATWLCLKYGPHGGGHGHPDKLSFVIYARGHMLALDPGLARYGTPIHQGWYRQTIAHNTLTVDEASQTAAEGKCIAFGSEKGIDYAVADAGPIGEGISFNRTAAMLHENLVVFIDQVRCDKDHTLDLAYHQRGVWEMPSQGQPWTVPSKPGYKYLRDASIQDASQALRIAGPGKGTAQVTLADGQPTEVITATGVGSQMDDRVPMVIFRRKAKETAFIWCVALNGKPVTLEPLEVRDSSGAVLSSSEAAAVRVTSGGKTWEIAANPGRRAAVVAGRVQWNLETAFAAR